MCDLELHIHHQPQDAHTEPLHMDRNAKEQNWQALANLTDGQNILKASIHPQNNPARPSIEPPPRPRHNTSHTQNPTHTQKNVWLWDQ